MTTDVVEPTEGTALPGQAVHFRHGLRRVMTLRIAGAVMLLPFIATLIMRTSGFTGMLSLIVAALGGLLIFHAQRTLAARPDSVMVDGDGITVLHSGARPHLLRWREMASVHRAWVRGIIDIGTRSDPYAMTIDADLTDTGAFLTAVTQRIDASRRDPVAPIARPARGAYERPLHVETSLLAVAAVGVASALLVHPAFIVVTVFALPVLAWHWASVPQRVIVDATAVWIVRPLARDVLPLRAITDAKFRAEGRIAAANVVVEHRDRGDIVISGSGEFALPIFDAIVSALNRAAEAARTGAAPARAAAAIDRADFRRTALMHAGGALLVLVAVAWLTVLSGIPLRKAAGRGHTGVARAVLLFPAPIGFAGSDGFTALHHAASHDDVALTRALIRRRADVDAQRGVDRFAPLHTAALRGSAAVATLLITAAADVDAQSARGSTPLALAALSSAPGDADVARLLLDAGAAADIGDEAGRTPLHHAAATGDAAMIRLLARARAYIEAVDSAGDRALHLAARDSRTDALAALLESGANANAPGAQGRTALATAATNGASAAITDMLLAAGARADLAGADGWNAAQLAAGANNIPALELFARRRVRLDASDGNIPPALHIAVDKGSVEAVRVLLRGGANPYREWNGRSAVERARSAGNARMVALMQMR